MTAKLFETRREVGYLDRRSCGVVQPRDENGGVLNVLLLAANEVVDDNIIESKTVVVMLAVQKAAEERIAVEVR